MEGSNEDDFEEAKIDIKLEESVFNDMVVHDSFDTSDDSILGKIKQEESIDSGSEENMSNKDTTITKPTISLKMEYSNDGVFEETKNDIILNEIKNDILGEIKLEAMDIPDYIDIREDIAREIKQEKLLIKSEVEDPCEDNSNREERNLAVKPSLRSASKSKDDSTFVTNINCSKKEHDPDLKSHRKLLRHRSETKTKMFGCHKCDYQTKVQGHLTSHMRRHKSVTEIEMFSCDECDFQTKYKSSLNSHKLQHKDSSEVNLFSCEECDYQSRFKGNLTRHMFRHKSAPEIEMFSCIECGYQSRHKDYLRKHMLQHKSLSEIEMFSCEECDYQTKNKRYLTKHNMFRHKSVTEIEMFKCGECGFLTKYKYSLTTHKLQHKSLTAFSYKKFLEKHNLRLESTTEDEMFRTHLLQHN